VSLNSDAVDTQLKPYIDAIRGNLKLLESPAGELAGGEATNEEHAELLDEGIAVLRLPVPPRDLMN